MLIIAKLQVSSYLLLAPINTIYQMLFRLSDFVINFESVVSYLLHANAPVFFFSIKPFSSLRFYRKSLVVHGCCFNYKYKFNESFMA